MLDSGTYASTAGQAAMKLPGDGIPTDSTDAFTQTAY